MTIHRIKKINVLQTSVVIALISFVSLPLFSILKEVMLFIGDNNHNFFEILFGKLSNILLNSIVIAPSVFLITALCCLIYNWVANRTGGIEIEIEG